MKRLLAMSMAVMMMLGAVSYTHLTTTMPSLSDTTNWTELTEGYTPMSDSPTSQLTLTEDMFGKYIKVEFVPNNQEGFSGNVVNPTNNDGFIKRVYEETVTLTSSTSDGNGNPKAYAGTTLTGTVNNSVETTLSRTTARFKIGSSYVNGSIDVYKRQVQKIGSLVRQNINACLMLL